MHYIGNIFNRPISLDLLPGCSLPNGIYQITLTAVLVNPQDTSIVENCCSTWHTRNFTVFFGDDVYSIMFTISAMNGGIFKQFSMLKSDLLLLNIAYKLVCSTP
jgi:hypothetical protein